jgi:hypothetical protein
MAFAGEAIARLDYESAAASALEQLAARHPDLRERIEKASGVGTNKAFIVEELRLALEGTGQQEALAREYGQLLDEIAVSDARSVEADALGRLAAYDIGFWSRGWAFYYRQPRRDVTGGDPSEQRSAVLAVQAGPDWQNIIGVLITAILLSLGAPFWFDRLRDIVGLRDRLKGTAGTAPPGADVGGEAPTPPAQPPRGGPAGGTAAGSTVSGPAPGDNAEHAPPQPKPGEPPPTE